MQWIDIEKCQSIYPKTIQEKILWAMHTLVYDKIQELGHILKLIHYNF